MTRYEQQAIEDAARKYGIRPAFLFGIWGAETDFSRAGDTYQPNSAGAKGPFQFTPGTAASDGLRYDGSGPGTVNDFRSAAFGAARELAKFKAAGEAGMAAGYNGGPGAVHGHRYSETVAYIPKVLAIANTYPGTKGRLAGPDAIAGATGTADAGTTQSDADWRSSVGHSLGRIVITLLLITAGLGLVAFATRQLAAP